MDINKFNSLIKGQHIGEGSFGSVQLYKSNLDNTLYAIKSVSSNDNTDEVLLLTKFNDCIFINKCHYIHNNQNSIQFVLDFETGGCLYDVIHIYLGGVLLEKCAKLYIAEIAIALKYLHSNNIIYRDLKLENILISSTGHIKLCDFGISCLLDSKRETFNPYSRNTICGTIEYLSPEMVKENKYTNKVDIWCLGIVLYEMIFGETPFENINIVKQFTNIILCKFEIDNANNICRNYLMSDCVKECINRMLTPEDVRFNIDQLLQHKWFNDINLIDITQGIYANEPPYVPKHTIVFKRAVNQDIPEDIPEDMIEFNKSNHILYDDIPCIVLIFSLRTYQLTYFNKLAQTSLCIPDNTYINMNSFMSSEQPKHDKMIHQFSRNEHSLFHVRIVNMKIYGSEKTIRCTIDIRKHSFNNNNKCYFVKCIPEIHLSF